MEIQVETPKEAGHFNGISFPSDNVMLDLKDLKKVYPTPKGDYVVLEHLNLQILKEEFVTIIGHSGCGKTTMLSMIAGLNEISGGNISVLGILLLVLDQTVGLFFKHQV